MSTSEDRMAKARAAKKPPQYKNIHEDVKSLPDDSTLSVKNVKEWEKYNKDRVKECKYKIRRLPKGKEKYLLEREVENRQVYLANIVKYFDTSTWTDLFYGKNQEFRTRYRTLVYAYDNEGFIRTDSIHNTIPTSI